jgi:RND family efflux transporter MFP subunit
MSLDQLPLDLGEAMQSLCTSRRRQHARALATIILVVAALAGCGSNNKAAADNPANAPQVAVVRVERGNLSNTLEIASEFQPYQEVDVYAKVSGYIQTLDVDWGTHVKEGQLLAVLEIPELEQQLQLDEAAVRRSEQDEARTREELGGAESAYTVAHLTYTRMANVQKTRPELVAQEEVDIAQGKDIEANANVSAKKDSLSASEQALVASQASLAKDKDMFAYSRITAPFEGVVTRIDAYKGSLLPAGTSSSTTGQALCHLSQNNVLRLVIPVPERAVADVHLGDTVAVQVTTVNKTFNGTISRISGQIDMDTRTMHTEVEVQNADYALVPGMYATVRIPLHAVQNVLTVPVQSVQTSGENHGAVLVVGDDNRIERRDVTLGLQSATDVEILSGLKQNERVVFGEQSQYRSGELVVPKIVAPSEVE